MNSAKAKSFSVWPPNTSNVPIGSSTTRDVFTERIRVWFSDRLTMPEYVSRETRAAEAAFSFTLSKMTTVSFIERPMIVRKAAIIFWSISKFVYWVIPSRIDTAPRATMTSWKSAMMAPTP